MDASRLALQSASGPATAPATAPAMVSRRPGSWATDSAEQATGDAARGRARTARRARRHAEDVALVQAIRRGEPDAFTHLVERYQRRVFWLAHDILLDPEEARDVAQETFLRLHASLDRYDERRDFVNWLYRIARNLSIDLLRRRRRQARPVEDVEVVAPEAGGEGISAPESSAAVPRDRKSVV